MYQCCYRHNICLPQHWLMLHIESGYLLRLWNRVHSEKYCNLPGDITAFNGTATALNGRYSHSRWHNISLITVTTMINVQKTLWIMLFMNSKMPYGRMDTTNNCFFCQLIHDLGIRELCFTSCTNLFNLTQIFLI